MKGVTGQCQMVSNTPGRLRVRMDQAGRRPDFMEHIKVHLENQAGIRKVHTNTSSGSVLVRYNEKTHSHHEILAMLRDIGVILYEVAFKGEKELSDVGPSSTAAKITRAISDLDNRIHYLTGGTANLRLMVPLLMGAFGVWQIRRNGWGLTQVPGYVLLWYAFDAFYKFHQKPQS
ncbi:MAG: HMA2 domain-containing protein [bacterium]